MTKLVQPRIVTSGRYLTLLFVLVVHLSEAVAFLSCEAAFSKPNAEYWAKAWRIQTSVMSRATLEKLIEDLTQLKFEVSDFNKPLSADTVRVVFETMPRTNAGW